MSSNDLLDRLPRSSHSRFRSIVLRKLLIDSGWRVRRTDRFIPWDTQHFRAEYSLAFRLPRRWIIDALDELAVVHRVQGADSPINAIARAAHDEDTVALDDWDSATVLLPLCWIRGPLVDFRIELDGNPVVPLTRYQTADVVARSLAGLASDVAAVAGVGLDILSDPARLAELFWCLLASDSEALGHNETAPFLKKDNDRAYADWVIGAWMRHNAAQLDVDDRKVLDQLETEVRRVFRESVRKMKRQFGERQAPPEAYVSPFWNPLLMHGAFLRKRLHWDRRHDHDENAIDSAQVEKDFIHFCDDFLRVHEWLSDARPEGLELDLAAFLWDVLQQAASNYPIVVRATAKLEEAHVADYSVSLRARNTSRRELRYFLSSNDAISYHVEVTSPHAELQLVSNRASVEVPYIDYRSAKNKRRFENTPASRRRFRRYRVPAKNYFHRAEQDGPVHSFYETNSDFEHFQCPDDHVGEEQEWGGSQLIVRYRLLPYVWLTNVGLAVVLSGSALYLLAMSLVSAVASSSVPFAELARSFAPVYMGVVLLFTFERHNNAIVAKRLSVPWGFVIGATTLALASLLGWACAKTPEYVPGVAHLVGPAWAKGGEWLAALLHN